MPTDIHVFHAGTAFTKSNELVTSGGRVLSVVALDHNLETAVCSALEAISRIKFHGVYYRKDIARTAFKPR